MPEPRPEAVAYWTRALGFFSRWIWQKKRDALRLKVELGEEALTEVGILELARTLNDYKHPPDLQHIIYEPSKSEESQIGSDFLFSFLDTKENTGYQAAIQAKSMKYGELVAGKDKRRCYYIGLDKLVGKKIENPDSSPLLGRKRGREAQSNILANWGEQYDIPTYYGFYNYLPPENLADKQRISPKDRQIFKTRNGFTLCAAEIINEKLWLKEGRGGQDPRPNPRLKGNRSKTDYGVISPICFPGVKLFEVQKSNNNALPTLAYAATALPVAMDTGDDTGMQTERDQLIRRHRVYIKNLIATAPVPLTHIGFIY